MIDPFGRTIDYLRVSVTEHCNFRCVYCLPEDGVPCEPPSALLSTDEILRVLRAMAPLGLRKVRLTGGEPTLRKDLVELTARIAALPGIEDLSLTTNGFLLARLAGPLAGAGLHRVNVSLDSLRRERFVRVARRGDLATVRAGIEAALAAGLHPVKINVVLMRGVNDDELTDFARLTVAAPLHVRFIELMPIGWGADESGDWAPLAAPVRSCGAGVARPDPAAVPLTVEAGGVMGFRELRSRFVSCAEARERVEAALGGLEPAEVTTNGPARNFRLPGARGTVGFISQVSDHVCARCNRMRLTADGMLRPCLMADNETDLRGPLRAGADADELRRLVRETLARKPERHYLAEGTLPVLRSMSHIGG